MSKSWLCSSMGESGHVEPSVSKVIILSQVGWFSKIGAKIETGLNSEPYWSGDPFWAWRAWCRSPPNLCMRIM